MGVQIVCYKTGGASMETGKRGPGRPQALSPSERRARILDAAGQLFIEEGYTASNMERVAQRCGMSKKTVYQAFESKEKLFAALVCDVDTHESAIPSVRETTAISPQKRLSDVLLQLAEWVLAPRQIGLTRLVIAEALSVPDLAAQFRGHAIERGRRMIRECMAEVSAGREVKSSEDLEELASMAFGAVIADLQLRALVGEDISVASVRASLMKRINIVVRIL